jgi:uncharacterized membrane protein YphA (DoxX/SURF4 family)
MMDESKIGAGEPRSMPEVETGLVYSTTALRGDCAHERAVVLAAHVRQIEGAVARWMSRHGMLVMRVGLGVVYFWFGALKLFPGLSPAQELVTETVWFLDPRWFIPLLGVWEIMIGLCLMFGVLMRFALLLFFLHLPGTVIPLLFLPHETWTRFPFAPTLEGQYILKNLVSLGAALVLGGKMGRGRADPTPS